MSTPSTKSIVGRILLPWQWRWVNDRARFKIGLWSRQTGKSFSTACEAVTDSVLKPEGTQSLWVVLSAGERQALEWMQKAKWWAKELKAAIEDEQDVRGSADAILTRSEITFANGARIVAIPANPDTARGYSGNLVLDEFAIHERPADIWAAIYPSITNPLTGEKKLRIVSTPKGRGNKFADLWEHNANYSKHKVTIMDAAAMGLWGRADASAKIAELRETVDDPDIWAQEFLCEFVDSTAVLLPYEMIGSCESDRIADDGVSPKFIGMDVGRRHDLSVIVTAVRLGDVLAVTEVEVLAKMAFDDQLRILCGKGRDERVRGVAVDASGIGAMLAENAAKELGAKVREVSFNQTTKNEMFTLLRRKFEERTVRVPVSRDLREDLHAMQRVVSASGAVSYSAPRNSDGHSDRAAALALCCLAASDKGEYVSPFNVGRYAGYERRAI